MGKKVGVGVVSSSELRGEGRILIGVVRALCRWEGKVEDENFGGFSGVPF